MASSGSFSTSAYTANNGTRSLVFSWTEKSQSIEDNTTTISWTLTGGGTHPQWISCRNIKVTIDGVTVYTFPGSSSSYKKVYKDTVVASGTYTFTHKDDGERTFKAYVEAGIYVWAVNCTGSTTFTLDTIPRKSTLSVDNGTLGTEQTLTITEKASSFKHKLKYTCGDASGWILGDSDSFSTSNSVSWTPPLSLAKQNTTGASVSVTFTLYTYTSDGTSVGNNSYTKTFSIPSSVKPTVSLAVSDSMKYADTYGAYVQGLSKLHIVATASGSQGSTIKSYKIEADGKTYTTAEVTSGVVSEAGTLTIKVTVTDSRSRTATASKSISVLAYDPPKITALSAFRCDAGGNASNSGAYLAVKFSATVTTLNNKNSATYTLQYKKSNATSYTTKTLSDFADRYSVSNGVYVFPAETAFSYDIILTVKDDIKSVNKPTTGSSVKKVWSMLKKAGEIVGIAIGKIAELEGVFDVDMVIRARKGISVDAEWIDLTIADNFALYGGTVANQPKCKMTGNVVTVMGILTPETEFTSSTTGVNIASGIPANMRPSVNLQFVCQGSSMNRWDCSITTGGAITLSRYGTTEATKVTSGAWLPFCVTYQI